MITSNSKLEERFTEVFEKRLWIDSESVSGPGSNRSSEFVKSSMEALQYTVNKYSIKTMSDIPCGDMNWMPEFLVQNQYLDYTGYDIVDALIDRNTQLFGSYKFRKIDITQEVPPKTDLLFCKELLLHLQYEDICKALNNMKRSGSEYLLLFNNFGAANIINLPDLQPGTARGIDVCSPPFRYPSPIWRNQCLGLWKLADVPEIIVSDTPILPEEQTSVEMELRTALDEQIYLTKRLQEALIDQAQRADRILNSRSQKIIRSLKTVVRKFWGE